jgi:predicted RNase H-like HicB family nuclease
MKYLFVIEKAPRNYGGYFPDVPGCITTARTVEKLLSNAVEALELHLADESKLPKVRSLQWHETKGGLKLAASDLVTWIEYRPHLHPVAA